MLRQAFGTRFAAALAGWLDRHHRLATLVTLLRSGMTHYMTAWRTRRLLVYIAVAVVAYGLQAAVFAACVRRLWTDADWVASLHISATSTIADAASMIPGGLGAMELG